MFLLLLLCLIQDRCKGISEPWNNMRLSFSNEDTHVIWKRSDLRKGELSLKSAGEKLLLNLETLVEPIVDQQLVIVKRKKNSSEILSSSLVEPHCIFRSYGQHQAALNVCGGLRGIIKSEKSYFVIDQVPERGEGRRKVRHVVSTRSVDEVPDIPAQDGHGTDDLKEKYKFSRPSWRSTQQLQANSSLPPAYIEIAVFVDKDLTQHMHKNFPKDTEKELVRFVLAMVNAVEMLYNDPSLGRSVRFVMKRLEILEVDPGGLERSKDIDRFLASFCSWQSTQNPPSDSHALHWDHALILTGLDLFVHSKNGKISRQVVGLAPVAGMCTKSSSCTVNEGRHFDSVYVVAHEIGHNLGMRHDGQLSDNNCDPTRYLMSPTLGGGKTTWSSCSRQYLDQFLRSSQSSCLRDGGHSAVEIDHSEGGLLPGERYDADQQCALKYGSGSTLAKLKTLSDICRYLHCKMDRYTYISHPALEGTSCGTKKWCRSGICVGKDRPEPEVGVWDDWGPYTPCASGCLETSVGLAVSTRSCILPRPNAGDETCSGNDKKYKTCLSDQCNKLPKFTIQNFMDEVCSRARQVDDEIIGTGFQKISSDEKESCRVWCHLRGGGATSKGWILPDGTTCQTQNKQRYMYCISGTCKEFKCFENEDNYFVMGSELCFDPAPKKSYFRDKRRELAVGVWLPVTDCYYNCVHPGRGLRLVEKRPCHRCNITTSIQLCRPSQKMCQGIQTPTEIAISTCKKYKEKVKRLSGFGMQLLPSPGDGDRGCRLACQDESYPQRFYLVNGEDGWFPFGTDCSPGDHTKKAYCISGRCMEFGSDDTPLHESVLSLPKVLNRNVRKVDTPRVENGSVANYETIMDTKLEPVYLSGNDKAIFDDLR